MPFNFLNLWNYGIFGWLVQQSDGGGYLWLWICGLVLCGILSYLLGSLNFGIIVSKLAYRDDIRNYGSGNAGMTNMLRTYGKGAAIVTLLCDAAKAAVAVLVIGRMLVGFWGAYTAGLCCIIGHVYPVFFGFKGGKGVVTTAVMALCLEPVVFATLIIIFIIIVATTKYISLGSCICALIYPLVLYRITGAGFHILIASAVAAFIVYLHRSNIKRLREGTENKVSFKSKKKSDNAAEDKKSTNES